MPSDINKNIQVIGNLLQTMRKSRSLTQKQMADILGVSQSFLSRLERQRRGDVSRQTWNRMVSRMPELEATLRSEESFDVRRTYENALSLYHEGDMDTAGVMFENVYMAAISTENPSLGQIGLSAMRWRAGILRDAGVITGINGAEGLYQEILEHPLVSSKERLEILLLKGACHEMLGENEVAAEFYDKIVVSDTVEALSVRASTRLAAVLTKLNEHERAARLLGESISRAKHLDSAEQYSYAHEKQSILHLIQGRHDEAMNELLIARGEIRITHYLRNVQSHVLEGDILLKMGKLDEAEKALMEAEMLARDMGFGHQISVIATKKKGLK